MPVKWWPTLFQKVEWSQYLQSSHKPLQCYQLQVLHSPICQHMWAIYLVHCMFDLLYNLLSKMTMLVCPKIKSNFVLKKYKAQSNWKYNIILLLLVVFYIHNQRSNSHTTHCRITSVPKKRIASKVVTHYWACYTFFRNRRYLWLIQSGRK